MTKWGGGGGGEGPNSVWVCLTAWSKGENPQWPVAVVIQVPKQ